MPSWPATCFSSTWGGGGARRLCLSGMKLWGRHRKEGSSRGRTVQAALRSAPSSLQRTRRRVWQGGDTEARHHHAPFRSHLVAVEGKTGSPVQTLNFGRYLRIKGHFPEAVLSAVPFQGSIDGGTKHVVVGIPPPPSRCPIHPTLSSPLLYLPSNNPKSPLTRFLLPI